MNTVNEPLLDDSNSNETRGRKRSISGDGDDEDDAYNKIDDENSDETSEDETTSDESDEEMIETEKLNENEFQQKLDELEKSIVENKYQYQFYVDIIKLTRDNGNLNKLREYREKMSEVFPLSEGLWLEWLKDEQKLIESTDDRQRVNELFLKAVQDYLSVEIWLEYIQFSIGGMGDPNGIENIRLICEKAISFAGFHVSQGYLLWEAYREFEMALLTGYQQSCAGSVQTVEQTKMINDQLERIYRLFKLQLTACLDNLEQTVKELKQFDESKMDKEVMAAYEKTMLKYKQIEKFEIELKTSKDDHVKKLNDYKTYIEFELKVVKDIENRTIPANVKNKAKSNKIDDEGETTPFENEELKSHKLRLKCLFERAISDNSNCLDESLWVKYIYYLNEEDSIQPNNKDNRDFHLQVSKRSIRNCPWSSKLWINYALMLEKTNSTTEIFKSVYNEAMNAGLQTSDDYLQIWHCYLDYLRRSLIPYDENLEQELRSKRESQIEEMRDAFQKAINQLYEYFKHNGDPGFTLEKYWVIVEAKCFRNMEKARKIFNEMIITKGNVGKFAVEWIEFYDLEKMYGDEKHQRKLLNRALNEVRDNLEKEIIYELIFKFEKLNGNVNHFNAFYWKYQQFKQNLQIELANKVTKKTDKVQTKPFKKQDVKTAEKKDTQGESIKPPKSSQQLVSNNLKRKKSENDEVEKKRKVTGEKGDKMDNDGFLIPTLPLTGELKEIKKTINKNEANNNFLPPVQSQDSVKKNVNMDTNLTVFISNLSFEVEENKVRAVFEKEPGFKDLRILKHWSGKSKGFGYVDFETPDQAQHVLRLDRTPIDGRPLFISPNTDKSLDFGQSKFKYPVNMEKKKLFVSGLPFSTTKENLEEIFKAFGKLKEVRIVTYKNGKSKGLAYVDFEDEQSTSKALIQTDGMLIGEQQIAVAISNPPKRDRNEAQKDDGANKTSQISGLGSGSLSSRASSSSTPGSNVNLFLPRSQIMNTNRKKTINF